YRQAAYWKRTHQLALLREAELRGELDSLRAQLRLREQQLFGAKSENHPTPSEALPQPKMQRPRGQQPGSPGHPRRDHSHLPAVQEVIDLPDDQRQCPCCGLPFDEFPGTEGGEILEVEVKAYRRVYRRRRYRPTCSCEGNKGIVTAPTPAKLIPKNGPGVSVWVELLLDKYLFYRPTYRLLEDCKTHGLRLSLGTLTDGLQKLLPLFGPVYAALVEHNQGQVHWHADETLAGLRHGRRQGWPSLDAVGLPFRRRGGLRAGLRQGARRAGGSPRPGRGGHPVGGPLFGLQGDETGQARPDPAGLLLGARQARLPGGGAVLAFGRGLGVGLGTARRPVVPARPGAAGSAGSARGVRRQGRADAPAAGADGTAGTDGTVPAGHPPGAAEGAGEPARTLGRLDGVRGAPGSAAGQQHGGAGAARAGGGQEELPRFGRGVVWGVGGAAVQHLPDAVPVGRQPARVACGIPARLCQSRRRSARGVGRVAALADERTEAQGVVVGPRDALRRQLVTARQSGFAKAARWHRQTGR